MLGVVDRATDSERSSAQRVAASEWGRSGELSDVHLGINRQTWKVEPDRRVGTLAPSPPPGAA